MNSYNYMASYFVEILPSPSYVRVLLSVHYTSCLKLCNLISHPFDGYSSVVEKSRRKERTILNRNSIPKESDSWASKWESLVSPQRRCGKSRISSCSTSPLTSAFEMIHRRGILMIFLSTALCYDRHLMGTHWLTWTHVNILSNISEAAKSPLRSRLGASDELNG